MEGPKPMLLEYENVDTKGEKMLDVGNTVVEASTVPRGNAVEPVCEVKVCDEGLVNSGTGNVTFPNVD